MNTPNAAYDWDLVVVGASFAGAACALAAAEFGLRVCVLERKEDPGARLHTTGILVKEVVEQTWLQRIPPALLQRVERVRLYAPNLRSVQLAAPGYYFMTTDTPNLMRWLAAELPAHGVELRLQQSFTEAVRDGEGWQVAGAGRTRYLVGADGARSRVAQRTGLGRVHDTLFGIEQEFAGL
ncbi:MAG TPA: NAD(P)/FAD-dependent oxidoreductase, partial [Stenotrophomonas sp.]|nr:NAD(P)/FAD-dependent oxidoreductase [Stenotrophomonas sp.]